MLKKIIRGITHPKLSIQKMNGLFLKKINDLKGYADYLYFRDFGRHINWINPTEMNEKIRWMQIFTDTSKWSLYADKYEVRKVIEEKGYGRNLVKLYGVWENTSDIDFSSLPNQFVMKTNHGCGSIYIVKDKTKENLEKIRNSLSKDLQVKFGRDSAEPHYLKIKPVVIAEELLEQNSSFSSSLIDYKFYCVNGLPLYCAVMLNRSIESHSYDVKLYDMEWRDCSEKLANHVKQTDIKVPRPENLTNMIKFCKEVCAEFAFVRMDFYEVNGNMFFGEFTFTPAACSGGSLGKELCNEIGAKIRLHQVVSS